jgi:predicted permease
LYRAALKVLPPSVREEDEEEMAWTFRRLWGEEQGPVSRIRLASRSFGRLPWVALAEWRDHFAAAGGAGGGRITRRWGMTSWIRNLSYAMRTLRKTPSFAVTTVVLVALGVGAVTTIFTLVDHVVLRPLPYPSAERLFLVENGSHSGPTVREFQEMRSVEAWGFARQETSTLSGDRDPMKILTVEVSRDFFSLFGVRPAQGRLFVEEDHEALGAAVLAHGAWERVYGSDPDVVGRTIRIDGEPHLVIGVAGEDFQAPEALMHRGSGPDVWLPLDWGREQYEDPGYHVLEAVGRMAEGATIQDVETEITRAVERLGQVYPDQYLNDEGEIAYHLPPAGLQEITTRPVRRGLNLLLGAVAVLLLVACMNVAHLFLARGLARIREMAVRRALGADTPSLVQQLFVESLVLGALGGLLGVGLAHLGLETFLSLNPTAIPRTASVSLDLRVLVFAGLVSTLTVLVFGLVPALRSMGEDLVEDLKGTSRSSTVGRGGARMRSGLVVAEVALSLMLVASAGLLLKSFLRVQGRDAGFRTAQVWTVPLTPSWIDSPEQYREAMDRIETQLEALPGVSQAAYSLTLPFELTGRGRCCWSTNSATVEGQLREGIRLMLQPVTETYFQALGIDLLAGRAWDGSEGEVEPWPVVFSEALAVELFGSADDAVGETVLVGGGETQVQVFGVARDTRHFGLDQDFPLFIYLPMEQLPFAIPLAHMAMRLQAEPPEGFAGTVREAIWAQVPDMPIPTVKSMEDWIEESTAGRRFDSVLFGSFGILAIVLAAAGLYGTLLYAVGQRRREMGIRLALGAGRGGVERAVVAKGFFLALVGAVLGVGGAWGTGRFLESRLYELSASDPTALGGAVAVLLAVSVLASWLPARRAGRVDPMEVLREE